MAKGSFTVLYNKVFDWCESGCYSDVNNIIAVACDTVANYSAVQFWWKQNPILYIDRRSSVGKVKGL